MARHDYIEISDPMHLKEVLSLEKQELRRCAFKGVDLRAEEQLAMSHSYRDCIFLGCILPKGIKRQMTDSLVFPRMGETFDTFPTKLYTADTLYEGYQLGQPSSFARCYDSIVYKHYLKMGKRADNIKETLARSLHDHSISNALHQFLQNYESRAIIGVMGGHGIKRTEPQYEQVARLSKSLTEKGFLMISGGGPGAMEATHLGAWMAGRSEEELQEALALLSAAPCFADGGWLETAMLVRQRWPQSQYQSLGIPTWLYGHEPSTPLATHIAKYFDNSIREDGILTIAMGGIVYTPGSAGTLQEIFQDAVQNHYLSYGISSPMCFMGEKYWSEEVPIYTLIQDLVKKGRYKNLILSISDHEEDIIKVLQDFRDQK